MRIFFYTASITTLIWFIGIVFTPYPVFGQVAISAVLDEPCTDDADCTTRNSYCGPVVPPDTKGKCRCEADHIPYTTRDENCKTDGTTDTATIYCLPIVNAFGAKCAADIQCKSGNLGNWSYCGDGTCQCTSGSTIGYSSCLKLATELGEACTLGSGHQCWNIPYSNCTNSKCLCGEERIPSVDHPNTCILPARKLGDSCQNEDAMCSVLPNTECKADTKTCQCETGLVPNERDTGCLEVGLGLNETCDESKQCGVKDSLCLPVGRCERNKTCQCPVGFLESEEKPTSCIPAQTNVNTSCTEHIQCTTELGNYSECSSKNECQCKNGGTIFNQICHPIVHLGEPCLFHEQCVADSTVIPAGLSLSCDLDISNINESDYRCQCPSETHMEYDGRCYEKTGFGLKCANAEQCKASLGGSELVVCHAGNSTCGCAAKYMVSKGESSCISETVALGGKCEESRQCGGSNQYCDFESGTCSCHAQFKADGEECVRKNAGMRLGIDLNIMITLILATIFLKVIL